MKTQLCRKDNRSRATEGLFKYDIIRITNDIITESGVVVKIAVRVADECTDKIMRDVGTTLYAIKIKF